MAVAKPSLTLDILICTIDGGIAGVGSILREERPDVRYIVSQQITDNRFRQIPSTLLSRKDVLVSQIEGKGLSVNRNNALSLARADIAVIADDDVRYHTGAYDLILQSYQEHPEADMICFKINIPDGKREYKPYPRDFYVFKKNKYHYISSIEISFRVLPVLSRNIRFDDRFGLGSGVFAGGEEEVFIHDCLCKGLKAFYSPIYIVEHAGLSSINRLASYDISRGETISATDAYKWPLLAIPKAIGRTLKYTPDMFANRTNPFFFLYRSLYAIFYVWLSNRKRNRKKEMTKHSPGVFS